MVCDLIKRQLSRCHVSAEELVILLLRCCAVTEKNRRYAESVGSGIISGAR